MRAAVRVSRTLFLIGVTFVFIACPQETAIWTTPGAYSSNLTFQLGRERGVSAPIALGIIAVTRCDSPGGPPGEWQKRAEWIAESQFTGAEHSAVRYGDAPAGYRTVVGPKPLREGCYLAWVSGTGEMRFHVQPSGRVVDLGSQFR
jgi:hypothetical protein